MSSVDEMAARVEAGRAAMTALLHRQAWCHTLTGGLRLRWDALLDGEGRVVRRLRGRKMRSWSALLDEVGAALQFGDYFGENAAALDECLADLDWLPTQVGYVLVISEPEQILVDEASADLGRPHQHLERLVLSFAQARETFAEPIDQGVSWDRPAVRFDVVLLTDAEHEARVRHLWRLAGAPLDS